MRWWRTWFRRRTLERDLARELDTHLEIHIHHLIASGLSPGEARRRALTELGGVDQVKEHVREARAGAWLDTILYDLRDACRGLRRTPGITVTAIGLIALVVGGNTTIYSMVHAVITKPAPGVHAGRLATLQLRVDGRPAGPAHAFLDYLQYASQARTLAPLLANQYQRLTLSIDNGSYAAIGGLVSSNYFETLGVQMIRGRAFTPDDQTAAGLVAVISATLWQARFHADEQLLGQSIVINGRPATVIGIAPPDFHGAWLAERGDLWAPIVAYHRLRGTDLASGAMPPVQVIGRLAPGSTLTEARAEFATLSARLQSAFPATHRNRTAVPLPYSMTSGGDSLVAEQAPRFLAIFSVVTALTLAIVCATVANLMLGRAIVRQRELALRQTLGASRGRIIGTLLGEGALIAVAAWATACVIALGVSNGVMHLVSQRAEGALLDLAPDWTVVAYAFALAMFGAVAFTMAPAVRAWRQELLPSLRAGELGVVAGRSKLSGALVILQLGFAVVLLTSAGLAYRSLSMLRSMDAGFPRENLLLVNIETADAAASRDAHFALLERMRERLTAVPGVQSVSYTWPDWNRVPVRVDGSAQPELATGMWIGPRYFAVLRMKLVAGHEFSSLGGADADRGVLVNQHLADRLWPGQSAIGRTLRLGPQGKPMEVVGVTPNGVFSRFQRETAVGYVFRSVDQQPLREGTTYFSFHVRYAGALDTIGPAVGRAAREVDNRVPIQSLRTMESELNDFSDVIRVITIWITLFAIGSLVIAAIGQYAVIAFDMRRRTRDFGVRLALGASRQQILGSVLGQGFRWSAIGLAIGFALSLAAGRAARGLLVGVTPTDAPTYLGVFTLLALASLLACYLPARRASRIDPLQALREE